MLYQFGKPFIGFLLTQFFSSIKLKGAARVEHGPVIFVGNHPNFALDPLLLVHTIRRDVWFLGKSTLFSNSITNWLLTNAHVIPVYRRQDSEDGAVDNTETFSRVIQKLREAQSVMIFPEGTSWGGRQLFPVKTGAARIAFQAEEESQFGLGLKIQPVGITYTNLERFRSNVTLAFGEPILISSLKDRYTENSRVAVRELTDQITTALEALSVTVQDAEHTELVEKIGILYATRGSVQDDHDRLSIIAKNVDLLGPKNPELKDRIEDALDSYIGMVQELGLDPEEPLDVQFDAFFLTLVMPFVLVGVLIHWLPYQCVGPIALKVSKHPVERATYKLLIGSIVFALWYALLSLAAVAVSSSWLVGLCVFVGALCSGYLVNHNSNQVRLYVLSKLWPGSIGPMPMLRMFRDRLVEQLESLRVE